MTLTGQRSEQREHLVAVSVLSRQALPGYGNFTVRAPVGQASTQFPQLTQFVSIRGSFMAGRISVRNPRPISPSAATGSTRAQVLMHLEQRMHLLGS